MRSARVPLIVSIALLAVACGSETGGSTTTTEVLPTTTSTAETATTTLAPTSTSTDGATTTTSPAVTTSSLAGDPIGFGPGEGDVLMVIGVAHDDVLNLRVGPGVGEEIVGEIPPTYQDLVARGNTRELPRSFWIEVEYERVLGWVNLSYIGYAGAVDDRTSEVVAALGGYPTNSTMTGLAEEVATVFALEEEPGSQVVQVTPVTGGDLAEVTYDVIGLADDSVRGLRLHIFAEEGSEGFTLSNVEVLVICGRGVDGEVCV